MYTTENGQMLQNATPTLPAQSPLLNAHSQTLLATLRSLTDAAMIGVRSAPGPEFPFRTTLSHKATDGGHPAWLDGSLSLPRVPESAS